MVANEDDKASATTEEVAAPVEGHHVAASCKRRW